MGWQMLFYIFYGLVSGLSEILPASAAAQSYLLSSLTALDTRHPLMLLMIHLACLSVLLIHCRHRIGHMRRELLLEAQSPRARKRQPDRTTVLDAKIVLFSAVPAVIMLAFSDFIYNRYLNLVLLSIALIVNGAYIYLPQFKPGANRDSRHLSPAEAVKIGFWSGFGAIPGFSRIGMFISDGLKKGCQKTYILDIAFLASIPALCMLILLDIIRLIGFGILNIEVEHLLFSSLAGTAAFGGAWLAVVIMRFVSVNASYSAFSYYSWALGMFSFILYLMV